MNLKNVKKISLVLILGAVVVFPVTVMAQSKPASSLKIAVLNMDDVRSKSSAYKSANEQLRKYFENMQALQKTEEQALRKANAEMSRKRTLLSPDAFAEERKKYEKRVVAFQKKSRAQQQEFVTARDTALNKIGQTIVKVLQAYVNENKISLVVPSQGILITSNDLVINGPILKRLNKALPSLKVSLPATKKK